jgi:hypothetical protein
MNLSYKQKEDIMQAMFHLHKTPDGYRSSYKSVPIYNYEEIKQFIDFTKYYVMFRGPRKRSANSTRKRDAHSFDVYERDARTVREIRIEREAFFRGVDYSKSHKV